MERQLLPPHLAMPSIVVAAAAAAAASLLARMCHAAAQQQQPQADALPHIIFVLTDDNGWAGVGYNNPNINTPTLDHLAETGLKLTSHYAYKFCAPTRASFLTGRLPYKLAATRSNLIPWTLPDGTHLSYDMLPKYLKAAGNYHSVHIGKWHQGLYTPQYTPVGRGFDESFGFLEGGEDHNTSQTFGDYCKHQEVDLSHNSAGTAGQPFPYTWPGCTNFTAYPNTAVFEFYNNTGAVDITNYNPYEAAFDSEQGCADLCDSRLDCAGYSWRKTDPTHQYYHHCFLVSKTGSASPAVTDAFNSGFCHRSTDTRTTVAAVGQNGTYTGHLFSDAAVQAINKHAARIRESRSRSSDNSNPNTRPEPEVAAAAPAPAQPLFMYLAMHNTHAPLEAPWQYVAPYAEKWPDDRPRSTFSGMLSFVDETVKNVTDALIANGMWNNTLFVWTNDNGSPVTVGGSNNPLRGGKGANWEGGVRVPTFVNGGFLPASQAGKETAALMHIADWYATFAEIIAGPGAAAAAADGTWSSPSSLSSSDPVSASDSVSAWPWISGKNSTPTRTEIAHDHRMFGTNLAAPGCYAVNSTRYGPRCVQAALRQGDWKLVVGGEQQNGWFGWFSPNASDPVNATSPQVADSACNVSACLFNIAEDMTEHTDVAAQHQDVVAKMLARVHELAEEYHPPVHDPPIDLDGYCAAIHANGNFVGPWMKDPRPDSNSTATQQ
jgi:arylsulfatase A-like enzyme